MRRLELRLFALGALLLLARCGQPDDLAPVEGALSSIIATCSNKSGDVQLKRRGEGFWTEASVASVLRAGDWVKTSNRSFARIELLSGGALELDEGATLVLELDATGSGRRDALVKVETGSVRGTFTDPSAAGLRIRMSDGSEADLLAQGDQPVEFRIARGAAGTDITLNKGRATLSTGSEKLSLEEGAVTALSAGAARRILVLGAPTPLTPLPDSTSAFAQGAQVTFKWSEVKAAAGYQLQLARTAAFTELVTDAAVEDANEALALPRAGVWYWRVAARDLEGRLGVFSRTQRTFALERGPSNQLIKPNDRATYAYVDSAPRITFAWNPVGAEPGYRLVIARGPDLFNDRIKSEPVEGLAALLEGLDAGQYWWGVYTQRDEPIFVRPYRLLVQRSSKAVLKAPKRIKKWGQ